MVLKRRPRGRLCMLALLAGLAGRAGAASNAYLTDLHSAEAIALLPPASSPLIAVLDTGFEVDHPALRSRLLPGYNAFDGGSDVALNPADPMLYRHGTAVASIISSDASLTEWPPASFPGARILPVKICCTSESGGRQSNGNLLRQGILYAAGIRNDYGQASPERARVINLSYVLSDQYDPLLLDAIAQATRAGCVVVTALGDGALKIAPDLRQYPGVIGVVAAQGPEERPITSKPIPVVPAPGTAIWALMPSGTQFAPSPSMGGVAGSSFATAVVSAVAAMMLTENPALSPADVATILSSGAVYDGGGLNALLAVQSAKSFQATAQPGAASGGGTMDGSTLWALASFALGALLLRRSSKAIAAAQLARAGRVQAFPGAKLD